MKIGSLELLDFILEMVFIKEITQGVKQELYGMSFIEN